MNYRGQSQTTDEQGRRLRAILADLRLAQRKLTAGLLADGRTQSAAVEVARSGAASLEEQLRRFASPRKLACKPGCPWCCYSLVAVTAPEAIAMAAFRKASVPVAQKFSTRVMGMS